MQPVLTKTEHAGIVGPEDGSPALAPPKIELSQNNANGNASTLKRESEHDDGENDWENASIYEEVLDDTQAFEYPFHTSSDICTADEAKGYRKRLHEIGLERLISETLGRNTISVRKLCTAFEVRIPSWLSTEPDDAPGYYRLLGLAMLRELNKRQRIEKYKTMDDAAGLINKSKNILVITGAGISTSLGIPDFRSKTTGFYSKLRDMGFEEPEEVFDLENFDTNPSTFYALAGDILPDLHRWTPTHQFIRLIQDKGKLLRNYTQNIDNIESHAGIVPEKLIQCHGSWATATCRKCKHQVPGEQLFDDVRAKQVSLCKKCGELEVPPQGQKRKRSPNSLTKRKKRKEGEFDDDDDSDGKYDIVQPGVMKPDITFFGEKLPDKFFDTLQDKDRNVVDLVIVIGTSMKVAPVSEIPQFVPAGVPQIYISRDPIHHINFDINLLGSSDEVVSALCQRAGWELKHEMIPDNIKAEVTPHDFLEHTFNITTQNR
ncbi:SIR2-domain-containing protein [Venturia nashicola]|uniref:SIR2-domain-containing protein n=1 Tax=Venturia nashicola TaxID=86259 RepID=A0A4Z1PF55_9PEZI|nr:SIR2-domain-containing protein [Venturia nashicola]TLD34654.1 SIR2-domain-containing protein [Venturia nashicola]